MFERTRETPEGVVRRTVIVEAAADGGTATADAVVVAVVADVACVAGGTDGCAGSGKATLTAVVAE